MDPLNITEDIRPTCFNGQRSKTVGFPCNFETVAEEEPFVNFAESLSSADLADIGHETRSRV